MLELEEHRRRMIAEVSAFIEWGLKHPDKVRRIPAKRIGTGGFSRTMQRVFWTHVFAATDTVNVDVFRRFVRWVRGG